MALRLGLGLPPRESGTGATAAAPAPLSGVVLSNDEIAGDAVAGDLVGYLYAVGGVEPVTFAILGQEADDLAIQNVNELVVATGGDLSGFSSYDVTIRATDDGGATADPAFTVNVTAVSNGSGLGESDGTLVVSSEGWTSGPKRQDSNNGLRISGKSGGLAKFVLDLSSALPGATYTVRWSADWSNLTKQGRKSFVGFGFKEVDNDFHFAGLKGDGASPTTMHVYQIAGAAAFQGASGITQIDAGAAAHGTKDGDDWLQIEIAGDGASYTLRTSADGTTWSDELTAESPSPVADATSPPVFGLVVFLENDDKGPFTLDIEFWQAPGGTGFTARKAVATGAANSMVTGYDTPDWNPASEFDAATGLWTPTQSGLYWIGGAGTPAPIAASGVQFEIRLTRNAFMIGQMRGIDRVALLSHRDSNYINWLVQVTAGEAYGLYQRRVTSGAYAAEEVWFSAAPIASTRAFAAYKATATGSIDGPIKDQTEMFDLGNDFDPSTGKFTAPSTGYYLVTMHGEIHGDSGSNRQLKTYIDNVNDIVLSHNHWLPFHSSGRNYSLGHTHLLALNAGQTLHYVQSGQVVNWTCFAVAKVTPVVAFAARRSFIGGSAGDVITGFTEDFDLGNNFNPSTGIFTVPSDGQYLVMAHGRMQTASNVTSHIYLEVDGVMFIRGRHTVQGTDHSTSHRLGIVLNLTAGQQLQTRQVNQVAQLAYFAAMKL